MYTAYDLVLNSLCKGASYPGLQKIETSVIPNAVRDLSSIESSPAPFIRPARRAIRETFSRRSATHPKKSRRSESCIRPFAGVRALPGFSSVEDGSRARSEENEPLISCRNRSPFSNPSRRACVPRQRVRRLGLRQTGRLHSSRRVTSCSMAPARPAPCAAARDR